MRLPLALAVVAGLLPKPTSTDGAPGSRASRRLDFSHLVLRADWVVLADPIWVGKCGHDGIHRLLNIEVISGKPVDTQRHKGELRVPPGPYDRVGNRTDRKGGERDIPIPYFPSPTRGILMLSDERWGFGSPNPIVMSRKPHLLFLREIKIRPEPGVPSHLTVDDILDWRRFCADLYTQAHQAKPSPGRRIWELMSEEARSAFDRTVRGVGGQGSGQEFVQALGRLLDRPDLYDRRHFSEVALPAAVREPLEALNATQDKGQIRRANRALLACAYPTTVAAQGVRRRLSLEPGAEVYRPLGGWESALCLDMSARRALSDTVQGRYGLEGVRPVVDLVRRLCAVRRLETKRAQVDALLDLLNAHTGNLLFEDSIPGMLREYGVQVVKQGGKWAVAGAK